MTHDLPRRVLEEVALWPATHVGMSIVGPEGVLAEFGDTARRFPLASVTKPLAASAVLLAAEEGELSLDDPAGPEGSTVRHLLAHASGLTPDGRGTIAAPGTRRIYSNSGFDVLAEAFRSATGTTLVDYLCERVVVPLEMTATAIPGSVAQSAVSTVADLARWTIALMRSVEEAHATVWHRKTIEELSSVQFDGIDGVLPGFGPQKPNDWGLGFEIRGAKSPHWTGHHNSANTFGHFGRSGTFVWIDPDVSLGVVALGDVDFGRWAVEIWPRLSDAILAGFANL